MSKAAANKQKLPLSGWMNWMGRRCSKVTIPLGEHACPNCGELMVRIDGGAARCPREDCPVETITFKAFFRRRRSRR